MSHEVESMFYVNETPWHGLGVKLESAPTTREAIVAAGLDWEVGQRPLFEGSCSTLGADGKETVPDMPVYGGNVGNLVFRKVEGHTNYRKTDGRILGVCGPGTGVLQNTEAFRFFDRFVDAKTAVLETAGSLRNGERIWILARLNLSPSVIVPGDEYLLLSNSHDGKVAVRIGFTPIRVVCANTLAQAHFGGGGKLLRVHHNPKIGETVMKIAGSEPSRPAIRRENA